MSQSTQLRQGNGGNALSPAGKIPVTPMHMLFSLKNADIGGVFSWKTGTPMLTGIDCLKIGR